MWSPSNFTSQILTSVDIQQNTMLMKLNSHLICMSDSTGTNDNYCNDDHILQDKKWQEFKPLWFTKEFSINMKFLKAMKFLKITQNRNCNMNVLKAKLKFIMYN